MDRKYLAIHGNKNYIDFRKLQKFFEKYNKSRHQIVRSSPTMTDSKANHAVK